MNAPASDPTLWPKRLPILLTIVSLTIASVACGQAEENANSGAVSDERENCDPRVYDDGAIKGTVPEEELWGLPIGPSWPPEVGEPLKFVIRMTGSEDLFVHAVDPDGSVHEPDRPPKRHVGSNWDRPGAEWGTGFTFDQPGCWRIVAARGDAEGFFTVSVSP